MTLQLSDKKRALLELLLREQGSAATQDRILEAGEDDRAALSFSEERIWFLSQFDPESPAYNMPAAFRLRGTLDLDVLWHCLLEVMRRHEILRTTFTTLD